LLLGCVSSTLVPRMPPRPQSAHPSRSRQVVDGGIPRSVSSGFTAEYRQPPSLPESRDQLRIGDLVAEMIDKEAELSKCLTRLKSTEVKLSNTEKTLLTHIDNERQLRRALSNAKEGRSMAEARLAAAEDELVALKAAHHELQRKATVAAFVRLAPDDVLELPTDADFLIASGEEEWNVFSWAHGMNAGRVVAAAVERGAVEKLGDADAEDVLAFAQAIGSEAEVGALIRTPAVAEALTRLVWSHVKALQGGGAAEPGARHGRTGGQPQRDDRRKPYRAAW